MGAIDFEQFRRPTQTPDRSKVPFQLNQPFGCMPELIVKGALDLETESDWVNQAEGVDFKPLAFSVSQGYFVNILRVRKAGVLSRHRHAGTVHAFTLRGRWHYLEHDWVAEAGDYVCEPPGETHTLVVPDDVTEMMTLFFVSGGYTYVDPFGTALSYEDVFTKLDLAKAHYEQLGLGADYVKKFIR
jgi:quercetin dioxygenase-like cupin family protein